MLFASGLLLILVAYQPLPGERFIQVTAVLWMAAFILAGAVIWFRRPPLASVAERLDRRAGTRDRLITALAFEHPSTPEEAAAHAECEAWIRDHFDGRRHTPWAIPVEVPWLIVPIISIAFLQLRPKQITLEPTVVVRVADPSVIRTAIELERMAGRLESQPNRPPGDLKKIAEALKQSASQLRKEASGGSVSAAKTALKELSTLENLLKGTLDGGLPEAPGDAFSKAGDGKQSPEASKKNDPKLAKKEEELGKKLVEGKNKERPIKAIENAAANTASKQGGNAGSGSGSGAGQVAGEMRTGNAGGMGQSAGSGKSRQDSRGNGGESGGNARELQGMISKLQEMKSGTAGGMAIQQPGPGDGESKTNGSMMVDASASQSLTGEHASGAQGPMGKGGNELEQGTKKTPFGNMRPGENTHPGKQVRITGVAAGGESIRAMIATVPGEEPAKAVYKPIYDAAKPAVEDALIEEHIPIGSRLFVKRYFEAIRPK